MIYIHLDGYQSFKRIFETIWIIKRLALTDSTELLNEVAEKFKIFPKVATTIAEAMAKGRLIDVDFRLDVELKTVEKYKPLVRPALDPEFALTLRLYSLDHYEVGKFLGYPECCIRSFIDNSRMFFDDEHLKELKHIRAKGLEVVLTAGFLPCSLNCKEAIEASLLSHTDDTLSIRRLDDKLKKQLPHSHPAYPSFFEILT